MRWCPAREFVEGQGPHRVAGHPRKNQRARHTTGESNPDASFREAEMLPMGK